MVTFLDAEEEEEEELVGTAGCQAKDHGDNCECSSKLLHGYESFC